MKEQSLAINKQK